VLLLVGAGSTDDGNDHYWGRNGEFGITVYPVTRTVGVLAYSVVYSILADSRASHLFNLGHMVA